MTAKTSDWQVVLVGDAAVGKSAVANRIFHDVFDDKYNPTLVEEHYMDIHQPDGVKKMCLVDTSGAEEHYTAMMQGFFSTGDVFLFVCDVTREDTVERLRTEKMELETARPGLGKLPVIVVANKGDLPGHHDVAKQFAEDEGFLYCVTSCQSNLNVAALWAQAQHMAMHPSVELKRGELYLVSIKAHQFVGLGKHNWTHKNPSPYAEIRIGTESVLKTKKLHNTADPEWLFSPPEHFVIPDDDIIVEIWDHHNFHKDEMLCSAKVDLGTVSKTECTLRLEGTGGIPDVNCKIDVVLSFQSAIFDEVNDPN